MENLENNTANNAGNGNNPDGNSGSNKTFTQEEVNRIVQERLARERYKSTNSADKSLEERERILADRERKFAFKSTLKDKGIPEEVLEALNCTSEETFNKSLEILAPYFQKAKEPIYNAVGPTGGYAPVDSIRRAMGLK